MRIALGVIVCVGALACTSEVPKPEPGQTCFARSKYNGSGEEHCPDYACYADVLELLDHAPEASGLRCPDGRCVDPFPNESWNTIQYFYDGDNYTLIITVHEDLLTDGYSLENFRKHIQAVQVLTYPSPEAVGPYLGTSDDTFEVVSYEHGLIHVRMTSSLLRTYNTYSTPLYLCGQTPGSLDTCTIKRCEYQSDALSDHPAAGAPIQVSGDFKLPIQPL